MSYGWEFKFDFDGPVLDRDLVLSDMGFIRKNIEIDREDRRLNDLLGITPEMIHSGDSWSATATSLTELWRSNK